MRRLLIPLIAWPLVTMPAYPWADHGVLTQMALRPLKNFSETCVVTSPASGLGKNLVEFNERIQIKHHWSYPFKHGEKEGMKISAKEILANYVDEPDWGPDQDLFGNDEYPELWHDDLVYVTKKTGPDSQSFRHLYFSGRWHWWEPIGSFQVPQARLGENPGRAILFFDLAEALARKKECYWTFRMLAWSLHYLEDLTQPYHVRQTPTKRFIILDWSRIFPRFNVELTGDQIGYYHKTYETWVRERYPQFQTTVENSDDVPFSPKEMQYSLEELAEEISSHADAIGHASVENFPAWAPHAKINDSVKASGDETTLNAETNEVLAKAGGAIRGWVNLFRKRSEYSR